MHEKNMFSGPSLCLLWLELSFQTLFFQESALKLGTATRAVYDLKTYLQVQTTSRANYILDTLQSLDAKGSIFFEMKVW